jgi:peptide/nickel transport system permease protein
LFTVFGWMTTARIVRGQVISLREREYVEAARAAGAGTGHMLFRQILPNVWAPILVIFSLVIPANITLEAALSFLSIGIQEPTPDLGRLIQLGASNASNFGLVPWMVFVPAVTLFVLVLAFNLLGDAVRDALDPKSSR